MTTVSYSGIGMYKNCPSSFKRKYLLKESVAEPTRSSAPAMFRGTDIHNSIENFLLGRCNDLHKEISSYLPFVTGLRTNKARPEVPFAFCSKWESLDFDDEEAEIRGYMDAVLVLPEQLMVYEWKTGKEYDEHSLQRNLYGLAALLQNPDYDKVRVITTYLDQMRNVETTYYRMMLDEYKWMWERRINSTKPPQPYPMRPNWKCRYCGFSKNQGGKCPN